MLYQNKHFYADIYHLLGLLLQPDDDIDIH